MESPISLPAGWTARSPEVHDINEMTDLLRRHEAAAKGSPSTSDDVIEADIKGRNADATNHLLVRDNENTLRGWASVLDRAAGRVLGAVTIDPDLTDEVADPLAASLYEWTQLETIRIGRERGLTENQLDSGAFAADERQQRWLAAAGLERVRNWWQMSRPVTPDEGKEGGVPDPRDEICVRLVARGDDGMPLQSDLRIVHEVLEASFADHFNSHSETFDEFSDRLRADPGHRWDHWWIAEINEDAHGNPGPTPGALPAGVLVGTASEGEGPSSTYVAYLGVLQSARGHGAAKALLNAAIADAASRGRDAVTLEVDADSPTGADGLYRSMGFETSYNTESWHQYLPVDAN